MIFLTESLSNLETILAYALLGICCFKLLHVGVTQYLKRNDLQLVISPDGKITKVKKVTNPNHLAVNTYSAYESVYNPITLNSNTASPSEQFTNLVVTENGEEPQLTTIEQLKQSLTSIQICEEISDSIVDGKHDEELDELVTLLNQRLTNRPNYRCYYYLQSWNQLMHKVLSFLSITIDRRLSGENHIVMFKQSVKQVTNKLKLSKQKHGLSSSSSTDVPDWLLELMYTKIFELNVRFKFYDQYLDIKRCTTIVNDLINKRNTPLNRNFFE